MIELIGKYSKDCKIFADKVEDEVISQVMGVLNHPAFENVPVRIMPDCHAGSGCVIGFTAKVSDKIIPNLIGVDIGCGMLSYNFKSDLTHKALFDLLDEIIKADIPNGCNVHQKEQKVNDELLGKLTEICKRTNQDLSYVLKSLGTLGGGNHFIECGSDGNNSKWLTVHSGSRNFGLKIANYHQKIAHEKNPSFGKDLSWLEGDDAKNYLSDMRVAQEFASLNRRMIIDTIITKSKHSKNDFIESIHNYISDDDMIRKGAISAKKDELVIIPWNMRDGLIIGKGKSNNDWNNSAPHGAGRVLSRSKAKELINIEDYKKSMEGIFTSCVNEDTIDESPMAYKPHTEVEQYLSESVEIIHRVKPFYNFKASEKQKKRK